ncbi:MAG: biotin--[acetyl-CoA-carboxylase] ligase [Candidatus Omnitrophica bacterium]|nr:biotin--[acetyl-CoA-carboxylase] ligase [Candidatus Omnitrophota bacterium]MCM8803198.1 biotin--[acetyl-CoA-carboxylase] ligase [Candidatus Omnitrophota bacterium]
MNMKIEGYPVYYYEEVTSTMDLAKNLVKEGREGIIVAEVQTEGRGRYGRKWLSPRGGLYFSFVLKKSKITDFLSEIICLCLIETMKNFGVENCKIKFPNDIIVKGKKICGVLIEKVESFYITGIGINVKKSKELEENFYICMEDITGKKSEVKDILTIFLKEFRRIKDLAEKDIEYVVKNWSENLVK